MIDYPILRKSTKDNPLGYGFLTSTVECKVTEKRNDAFYLELKCKNKGDTVEHLQVGRLIRAWTGSELGYQHFRIYDIKKNIEGDIELSAEHVFFDLDKIPVIKKKYLDTKVSKILSNLLNVDAVMNGHGFTINTNIDETISVDFGIQSVKKCLLGTKGSVLEGISNTFELIRSDQNISVLKSRGKEHLDTIAYAKNIDGFKCIENRDTSYTHLFPYAYKKSSDSNAEDTLIVCNPRLITMWEYEGGAVNICDRDFTDDVIWETKTLNAANLLSHAKKHAQKMKSDPPFSYEIDLAKVKIKSDKELQNIGIADTFTLVNSMYNIIMKVKVTELTIDSLTHTPLKIVLEQV